MFCVLYAVATLIVLGTSLDPSISICSPLWKVPDVWTTLTEVEFPPAPTANPFAPLFFPLIRDPSLTSELLTAWFKVMLV